MSSYGKVNPVQTAPKNTGQKVRSASGQPNASQSQNRVKKTAPGVLYSPNTTINVNSIASPQTAHLQKSMATRFQALNSLSDRGLNIVKGQLGLSKPDSVQSLVNHSRPGGSMGGIQ
tara:strand:+ start:439 stop:789 length:351 start_codon:yes stop_codon:yes gene_type:complete